MQAIFGGFMREAQQTPAGTTGLLVPFVIFGIIASEKIHHKANEQIFSVIVEAFPKL
ncbi:MAG: hypothetical protein LBP71_04015 [Spirochaetaceae bacterium]|nr:hypothetical protein [Spirochaetaceae bacterium]